MEERDPVGEHTSEEPRDPGIFGSTVEPGDVILNDDDADGSDSRKSSPGRSKPA